MLTDSHSCHCVIIWSSRGGGRAASGASNTRRLAFFRSKPLQKAPATAVLLESRPGSYRSFREPFLSTGGKSQSTEVLKCRPVFGAGTGVLRLRGHDLGWGCSFRSLELLDHPRPHEPERPHLPERRPVIGQRVEIEQPGDS